MPKKITMLTCYDANTAGIMERGGIDYLLVGDSVGMVVYGYPDTRSVTMDDMIRHVQAVRNGAKKSKIIADMPIGSDSTPKMALENAGRLIASGADMVKLEGAKFEVIEFLIKNSVHVFGHLGLLPQTAEKFCMQGKDEKEADRIFCESMDLDALGVSGIVLECVPADLSKRITEAVECPTIGIGAGKDCDGQVLVVNDILGLGQRAPSFAKQYVDLNPLIEQAVGEFVGDVNS